MKSFSKNTDYSFMSNYHYFKIKENSISLMIFFNNQAMKMQMIYLETSEAAATGKTDIADIWRAVGGDHFINH